MSSSQERSDSENTDYDEDDYEWVYEPGRKAFIALQVNPDDHRLAFVCYLVVTVNQTSTEFQALEVLASQYVADVHQINIDEHPEEIRTRFDTIKETVMNQQLKEDSQQLDSKLEKLFNNDVFLENVGGNLRDGEKDQIKEDFVRRIEEGLSTGPIDGATVKIYALDEEGDESGEKYLEVIPYVSPHSDVTMDTIREGELFEIRIVGESAEKLNSKYLENPRSKNPKSIPIPAKLISLGESDSYFVDFVVSFGKGVHGKGNTSLDTKVNRTATISKEERVVEQDVADFEWMFVIISSLFAILFSLVIMAILFPGASIYLLQTLAGA